MGKLNIGLCFAIVTTCHCLDVKMPKMIRLLLFPCLSSTPRRGICPHGACVCPGQSQAGREEPACGLDSVSLPAHLRRPGSSQSREKLLLN